MLDKIISHVCVLSTWALSVFFTSYTCVSQNLKPKQAYATTVKQIHSGHSLTDPLFYPHWPGQYVNLMGMVNGIGPGQLVNNTIGKSTTPGSSIKARWQTPPGYGAPDARHGISNWELLCITERVPLYYDGGSSQDWYRQALIEQREVFSQFVNNAWTNGNGGKGTPTLLWTTWVQLDSSNPSAFRAMLDIQGTEWEKMQDYANQRLPQAATPVYLIPGHKMMARLYDDIKSGVVPGISNIKQLFSDNIHTNELGAYAISMIHYACIYNKSPEGLPVDLLPNAASGTLKPSAALAMYVQKMVWKVVTSYPRTGISATTDIGHLERSKNNSLVHPNPATEWVSLRDENLPVDATVNIYSILGEVIYSGTSRRISLVGVPPGVYNMQIGTYRESFVVNRP